MTARTEGGPWTAVEVKRLRELVEQRAGNAEIGAELCRTARSVQRQVSRIRGTGEPMPYRQRPYSSDEVARMRQMCAGGRTVHDIAAMLGRTVDTTRTALKVRGLKAALAPPAKRTGRPRGSRTTPDPTTADARQRRPFTSAEIAHMGDMCDEGYTVREIAEAFGRTISTMKLALIRRGLRAGTRARYGRPAGPPKPPPAGFDLTDTEEL